MNEAFYQPATFDPDGLYRQLEDAAEKMTEAKEKADLLTELKKVNLARLTIKHLGKSRPEAEARALADPEYETYIRGMVEAERRANRLTARYHNLRVLAELRRTEEATRRSLGA